MKRLNVKKLAAVGVGAALMGMALAPMAAALTKSDVLKGDGTPFNVVVGSDSAHTDYLWGGNIAAKLAQLATEDTPVSCEATGWQEGQGPTGEAVEKECELSGLTADLSVGGSTTYKSGTAYTYDDATLDSDSGQVEWEAELGNSKLDNLLDDTWTYTFDGSNYTQSVKEYIGIKADAKMETVSDVRDLVVYLDSEGDFNYMMRMGAGIPYNPSFQKSDNNVIYVPWFGNKYTLLSADSSTVKLIDEADKKTYYTGEKLTGLEGKAAYEGEELSLEFVSLTYSSTQGAYSAKFALYDANGNLIDTHTLASQGDFLEDKFLDPVNGGYPLQTSVYVEEFAKEDVSDTGYTIITTGTNTVQLEDDDLYPYDSTVTSSSKKYWKVNFTTGTATVGGTTNVNVISEITVYNAGVEDCSSWDDSMPLWSTDDSLYEHDETTAKFLNCTSEDTLGYGFAEFTFAGWKGSESTTCAQTGGSIKDYKDSKASSEGIIYTDTGEQKHYIPFYINGLDSSTEEDFYFDGGQSKRYYFRKGTGVNDLNICDGNYLNGFDKNVGALGIAKDSGGWLNTPGNSADINGVKYVVESAASQDAGGNWCITVDTNGWFQLSTTAFDSGVTTVKGSGGSTPLNNKFYFDSADSLPTGNTQYDYSVVQLKGDDSEVFYYAYHYDSAGDIWLLLDDSTNFAPRYGYDLALNGTELDDSAQGIDASFYLPDSARIGSGSQSGVYRIAKFTFTENTTSQTGNVYIDTGDDQLIPAGNTNLSNYSNEATFGDGTGAQQTLNMTFYNEDSSLQKVWTEYGTKLWIEDGGPWHMCTPENQEYMKMSLLGPSAEVTTTGEEFEAVESGDTVETEAGTKVTVSKLNCACGTVTCEPGGGVEPGDVSLDVSPSVVKKINKIGTQIVYTDDEYFGDSPFVTIGGHLVNSQSAGAEFEGGLGLDSKLTASGDTVVDQTVDGDWVVAGYTASDTVTAAKQFINDLDAAFAE